MVKMPPENVYINSVFKEGKHTPKPGVNLPTPSRANAYKL